MRALTDVWHKHVSKRLNIPFSQQRSSFVTKSCQKQKYAGSVAPVKKAASGFRMFQRPQRRSSLSHSWAIISHTQNSGLFHWDWWGFIAPWENPNGKSCPSTCRWWMGCTRPFPVITTVVNSARRQWGAEGGCCGRVDLVLKKGEIYDFKTGAITRNFLFSFSISHKIKLCW